MVTCRNRPESNLGIIEIPDGQSEAIRRHGARLPGGDLTSDWSQDVRPRPVDGPMKVVINGRFLSQRLTGVQRVASEVTRAIDRLLDEGHYRKLEVRLLLPADADATRLELKHIATERVSRTRGHVWEQISLPRHSRGAALLCLGNSAPILSLMSGGQVAVILHDQAYRLFPEDYGLGYRLFHRLLGAVMIDRVRPLFTVSETARAEIAERHPEMSAPIIVAPNGSWIDDGVVAPPNMAPTESGFGLYVGSFSARKNIAAIFEAAQELAARRGMKFILVGPTNAISRSFSERIPEHLRSMIEIRGYVSNQELRDLYRSAACLMYPSFYEASGLPPSEAMSFGCPVIASELPVMRERCDDAALYCDPHRPETLVAAIERLIDDPALRTTLVARGYARTAKFTWRHQAIRVLNAVIEHAGRGASA
jgi:glycosyltransferase involved in cell wall biosynthesis